MATSPTPPQPLSAAQIFAQALAARKQASVKLPTNTVAAPSTKKSTSSGKLPVAGSFGTGGGDTGKGQDPLSWLVDILSRPLYAVTDSIEGNLEGTQAAEKIKKKGGSYADQLGAELNAMKNHNAITGFFSTDKANKHTTSDLIEKGTDVAGYNAQNGYKDRQNNVNPILKGVAGFAGDVVLDPTTWIPGGAIAKVAKMGLGAVKDVTKGASAARDIQKGVELGVDTQHAAAAAGEQAVDDATKVVPTTPETTVASKSARDDLDTAATDGPTQKSAVQQLVEETRAKVQQAVESPKGKQLKAALATVTPLEFKHGAQAVADTTKAIPLGFEPWLLDATKAVSETMAKIPKEVGFADSMKKFPKISIGGEQVPLPQAISRATAGDQVAIDDLRHWHGTAYTPAFNKAATQGKLIDPLGRPIAPTSAPVVNAVAMDNIANDAEEAATDLNDFDVAYNDPTGAGEDWLAGEVARHSADDGVQYDVDTLREKLAEQARITSEAYHQAKVGTSSPVTTVLNAMQNFKMQLAENEDHLRVQLGNGLVDNLKQFTNPISFDKTVSHLRSILDSDIDVTALKNLTPPTRRLLERLGLDPAAIPTGVRKLQGTAGELAPRSHVEDVIARTASNEDGADIRELSEQSLKDVVQKNVVDPQNPELYPYLSNLDKANRTEAVKGEGVGRLLHEFNTYTQADLLIPKFKRITELLRKRGHSLGGYAFAGAKGEIARQSLRLDEKVLDDMGIPLTMGVGKDRILLGGSQALDIVSGVDKKITDAALFNRNTAVPVTNFYDAVEAAVHGASRDDVKLLLANDKTRYGHEFKSGNPLVQHLVDKKGNHIAGVKFKSGQLLDQLTDVIERATPSLQRQVEENAAAYEARGLDETMKLTDENLAFLEQVFETKTGFGDMLEAISDTSSRVTQHAKDIGAMQTSLNKAAEIVEGSIPELDKAVSKAAVDTQKIADTETKRILHDKSTPTEKMEQIQALGVAVAQKKARAAMQDAAKFDPSGQVLDFGEKTQQMIGSTFASRIVPVFSRKAGNDILHSDLVQNENVFSKLMADAVTTVSHASMHFDRATMNDAMRVVQSGIPSKDPNVTAAAAELSKVWQQIFGAVDLDPAKMSLKDNGFFRENNSIYHINQVLQSKGLNHLFDADAATQAAKLSGRSIMDEAALQAKGWKLEDPATELLKIYSAFGAVNAHASLANTFHAIAEDLGAVSRVPKQGFERIEDSTGQSILAKYLPRDVYYQHDVLRQMAVVDSLMRDTLKLDGPIGSFIKTVYKPSLDMFKTGMTILNPNHHIRNALSDMDLTRDAEGITTRPIYKWAMEAIASKNTYDGFDAIQALNGIHVAAKPGRIIIKGKLGQLSPADLYSSMASRGVLPNFRRLQNLDDDAIQAAGPLAHLQHRINNTKALQFAGGVSEVTSHYTRLGHAAQFIDKHIDDPQYKTLNDLYDAAAKQVQKWHPDGSDLTHSEQILRLIIPFYSWQRKSIPLVIQTYLFNPARAEVLPKASYNLAVAMGVNPDSLSDPFPTDQMFPSYMTDKMIGPQFKIDGKYYGINPGFASTDAADTYLGQNPLQAVLGQVAPGIRAPFELAAGNQVGTGGRINDTSDYIDSQLPVVAPLSRLTGESVTGSIASILQGKGLDPQYQIAQGNKSQGQSTATAALNWLSGLGITPFSQPNQINYAEIEKRNQAGKAGSGF